MATRSGTPGAATEHYYNGGLAQTKQTVFTGQGNLYGFELENNSSSDDVFIQFFDKLAANVTVGSTTPDMTFRVPAGANFGKDVQDMVVKYFKLGCVIACTSTRTGGSAPSSSMSLNLWFVQGPQIS